MSKAEGKPESYSALVERLNVETARMAFEEFPKHLYHPDGRSIVVVSRSDQDARGEEFFESPDQALAERVRRDKRDGDAFISKVNAEAAEKRGPGRPRKQE